jgi:hypothetical protein
VTGVIVPLFIGLVGIYAISCLLGDEGSIGFLASFLRALHLSLKRLHISWHIATVVSGRDLIPRHNLFDWLLGDRWPVRSFLQLVSLHLGRGQTLVALVLHQVLRSENSELKSPLVVVEKLVGGLGRFI